MKMEITMEALKKIGRPRKYQSSPVSFGMKLTKEDKAKIKLLSELKHKPINETIMELVNKELGTETIVSKKIKAEDLLKLSKEERKAIIKDQAKKNVQYFEYIEDNQELLEY